MKTTYLYIKESPMGLKYLGKTEQNPETYLGSGTRWLNHIKKHRIKSKDIKTTILFETNDKILLKEMGLYYSQFYDVVNSKDWANLKPESGDGGGILKSEAERKKISHAMKNKDHSHLQTPEVAQKRNERLKGRKMPACKEETKLLLSKMFKGVNRVHNTEESYKKATKTKQKNGTLLLSKDTKDKIRNTLLGHPVSEDTIKKIRLNNGKNKKVSIDGIVYQSISEAERLLNKSRYLLRKNHKLFYL
jgi:hypothetical protein